VGEQGEINVSDLHNRPWIYRTNGATILMSVLIKANGQVQSSIRHHEPNSGGVETFRVIPMARVVEQYRTTNTLFEPVQFMW